MTDGGEKDVQAHEQSDAEIMRRVRSGLSQLPEAPNVTPGQPIDPKAVYTPQSHRSAVDPARTLVVGNRGMGKSFWAHALREPQIRQSVSGFYRQPRLATTDAVLGFDGSDRTDAIAPNRIEIKSALEAKLDAEDIWRAVVVRALVRRYTLEFPKTFVDQVSWIRDNRVEYSDYATECDDRLKGDGTRLLIMFDALDRLGGDWGETRILTRGLLSSALATQSYFSISFKIFMRSDQFEDDLLFDFPDASKIKNERVDLTWPSLDLYNLLFHYLQRNAEFGPSFRDLVRALSLSSQLINSEFFDEDAQKLLIDHIAGEHMGAGAKRGRVYTWVPQHLADANGQTSPRTFLTAWREASQVNPPKSGRAVDHLGINEGVRRASRDRLTELKEDYGWISDVLEPLRGELVPMDKAYLIRRWLDAETIEKLRARSLDDPKSTPITLRTDDPEALLNTLEAIGVIEVRSNEKINVPDIFRVEAQIKRKGGVKPPSSIKG